MAKLVIEPPTDLETRKISRVCLERSSTPDPNAATQRLKSTVDGPKSWRAGSSILIHIHNVKLRAVVDSGAKVSLVDKQIVNILRNIVLFPANQLQLLSVGVFRR